MITIDKTIDEKVISYEIFDDGYNIYLDGAIWITQHEPYGHPMDVSKSYEENCFLQIEELTAPAEPIPDPTEQRISELEDAVIELASLVG